MNTEYVPRGLDNSIPIHSPRAKRTFPGPNLTTACCPLYSGQEKGVIVERGRGVGVKHHTILKLRPAPPRHKVHHARLVRSSCAPRQKKKNSRGGKMPGEGGWGEEEAVL